MRTEELEELIRRSIQMEYEALDIVDRMVKEKFRKEKERIAPPPVYALKGYMIFNMGACA